MRIRTLARLATATAVVAVGLATAATAGAAAAPAQTHSAIAVSNATIRTSVATPDGAYNNCSSGDFCSFNGTDGTTIGGTLETCTFAFTGPPPVDISLNKPFDCGTESLANRTGHIIRLYWGAAQDQAYVCVPNGYFNNDVSSIKFNNGGASAPGYGHSIWNEVGSGQLGSGTCSNGL